MSDQRPQRQRVAAYAVILRGPQILLSRLDERITGGELWTLPGGGIDFGEDPAMAVRREVHEETGLDATVGDPFWIGSVSRDNDGIDWHALRLVYDANVPLDAPEPRVVEVDGSTVDCRWVAVEDVRSARMPVTPMVLAALERHRPAKLQRVAAYALVTRKDEILLTRLSARAHRPGAWTLPGGGLEHGESPVEALRRELREETGLELGAVRVLGVHDVHFTGTAPNGLNEDYHGIHLLYAAEATGQVSVAVAEASGTTDAAAWIARQRIVDEEVETLEVVGAALDLARGLG